MGKPTTAVARQGTVSSRVWGKRHPCVVVGETNKDKYVKVVGYDGRKWWRASIDQAFVRQRQVSFFQVSESSMMRNWILVGLGHDVFGAGLQEVAVVTLDGPGLETSKALAAHVKKIITVERNLSTYWKQVNQKVPSNVESSYGDFATHLDTITSLPDILYYDCCGHPDHTTIKKMFAMVSGKTKFIIAVTWCLRNMAPQQKVLLDQLLIDASLGCSTQNFKQASSQMVTKFFWRT